MSRVVLRMAAIWLVVPFTLLAQEESVNPGINASFRDPDAEAFVQRFEVESREVFARRNEIAAACRLSPGMTVADIGAGTGLFTEIFAAEVGPKGRVIAVDIAQGFLDHIQARCRKAGLANVDTLLCEADSTRLPPASIDLAFICDTYHHFEFPLKTMASLHRGLKPGGRLVLVDFKRLKGTSSEWILNHVRAGQDVFESEIASVGFKKVHEEPDLLQENYFVVFEKAASDRSEASSAVLHPLIAEVGGVVTPPDSIEPPKAGAKVVFDITATAAASGTHKGLERAARLLNLYGASNLAAEDVSIALVLHGDATLAVLSDKAFAQRQGGEGNPHLPLLRQLQALGVEVCVCAQALHYKDIADHELAEDIPIAASAMTALVNKQAAGYAYLPVP